MELVAAFRAESSSPSVDEGAASDAALEARLAGLVARGRAAYPELAVDGVAFVRFLARAVARAESEAPASLDAIEIEDLYLACACAAGVSGAAARFEERCGARLGVVLAAVAKSPDLRAEVGQRVRDALLVGTAAEAPKIANYGGAGALDRWVAVVAQRQVASLLRHEASEQRAREGAAVEAAVTAGAAPEVAYAKQRYRGDFEQAMTDALAALPERERLLLRLHLVGGLSVENIGKMYGVSQATASRWLKSARDTVSDEVTRLLRERMHASPDELASLAGLVASQIEVSISRLLGPGDR
ncbi:MAG TPA: sigma-70 family RNA polymerase sigma factor [Polyangia bacterium]|nr:sigma-70 family RNA polymerase sigma factor [Polyangia bacterium]